MTFISCTSGIREKRGHSRVRTAVAFPLKSHASARRLLASKYAEKMYDSLTEGEQYERGP
jgi:hypothetical protein